MVDTIRISDIDDSGRLRPIDPDHAALIAQSIAQGRLEQAIRIRPTPASNKPYRLVVGGHRLYAMREFLRWTELVVGEHVIVSEQGELDAKLSEVDENLARNELNPLDRALFMAERKRIYEEMQRTLSRGGDRKSSKFKAEIKSQSLAFDFSQRFTANAAKRLGFGESTIKNALRIASRLDPEAAAMIRSTLIETNQNELLLFIDMPPEEQRMAAMVLRAGEARTTAQARVAAGLAKPVAAPDAQSVIYARSVALIEKASPATKAQIADLLWPLLDARARKAIVEKYETF